MVVEVDKRGVTLLKSKLSGWHIIFGPVKLSSITWLRSENNINVVNIMSVSVVDNKIPVQIHQGKAKDDKQQLQLISTNPKERAINLSDPTLNPGEKG